MCFLSQPLSIGAHEERIDSSLCKGFVMEEKAFDLLISSYVPVKRWTEKNPGRSRHSPDSKTKIYAKQKPMPTNSSHLSEDLIPFSLHCSSPSLSQDTLFHTPSCCLQSEQLAVRHSPVAQLQEQSQFAQSQRGRKSLKDHRLVTASRPCKHYANLCV